MTLAEWQAERVDKAIAFFDAYDGAVPCPYHWRPGDIYFWCTEYSDERIDVTVDDGPDTVFHPSPNDFLVSVLIR